MMQDGQDVVSSMGCANHCLDRMGGTLTVREQMLLARLKVVTVDGVATGASVLVRLTAFVHTTATVIAPPPAAATYETKPATTAAAAAAAATTAAAAAANTNAKRL